MTHAFLSCFKVNHVNICLLQGMLEKNIIMNVMDEDSMDSISYIFPDNVTPFVNQVAGHEFTKAKPTIGM